MFWALSHNEDYFVPRVNLFVAAAPVTRQKNGMWELRIVCKGVYHLWSFVKSFKIFSVMGAKAHHAITGLFSGIWGSMLGHMISNTLSAINMGSVIPWHTPRFYYFPAQASLKEVVHYGQLFEYGDFAEFNPTGETPRVPIPLENIH